MFSSIEFLDVFALVLDLFVQFDAMKNIKGSMNNDLSIYKRTMTTIPRDLVDEDASSLHKLNLFLGMNDQFSFELKKQVNSISGSEDLIMDMINYCADCLESKLHLLPATKYSYLKAISLGLLILDNEGDERDITKKKKIKLDRLAKIIKNNPIVPLLGDSQIKLSNIFMKAPHIGNGKWDAVLTDDSSLFKRYNIVTTLDQVSADYLDFITTFKQIILTVF